MNILINHQNHVYPDFTIFSYHIFLLGSVVLQNLDEGYSNNKSFG
jgi:hypothetical protein